MLEAATNANVPASGDDRRYDGRFFSGVRTTANLLPAGLSGAAGAGQERHILSHRCRAPRPRASAPCLRCRPESRRRSRRPGRAHAPRSHRAMRLIRSGALDRAGVDAPRRAGSASARATSTACSAPIGASPLQVARTLRVQRAKRLLDQTKLPMADVAARCRLCQPAPLQCGICRGLQAHAERRPAPALQAGLMPKKKARHEPGPFRRILAAAYYLPVGDDLPSFQM